MQQKVRISFEFEEYFELLVVILSVLDKKNLILNLVLGFYSSSRIGKLSNMPH